MAEQQFKAGDVVRLKSGGPKMTIVNYGKYGFGEDEEYQCKWFDAKNNLTINNFTEAELELASGDVGTMRLERG